MTSHKSMVLILYVQNHTLSCNANLSSGASDIRFDLSPPLLPYFVSASSKGSGETGQISCLT